MALFFPVLSNDGAEFGGSIYQKVSDKLETAVNLAWTAGSNSTRFGIAAKYQLDKDASVSVSSSRAFRDQGMGIVLADRPFVVFFPSSG